MEQVELEHRSPKSHYLRTSRKNFEKQLGDIERRQARIRRIRQKLNENETKRKVDAKRPESSKSGHNVDKTQNLPEDIESRASEADTEPNTRELHVKRPESSKSSYHIGKTQNFPVDLASIASEAGTEPAMKVLYICH